MPQIQTGEPRYFQIHILVAVKNPGSIHKRELATGSGLDPGLLTK